MKRKILIIIFALIYPVSAFAFDHNHTIFDEVLKENVKLYDNGRQTKVDYKRIKEKPELLNQYLKELSKVKEKDFESWSKENQLAFLINAYNAFTIDLIVKHYPVKSIKDIGSIIKSPWKIEFIDLFGKKVSLDHIEHDLVRKKGVYDEPRIHFALVCASIGCPAIQNSAFTGSKLEEMLEDAMIKFLSDFTRNRYNPGKKEFEVSKIFKWYGDDFTSRYGSVLNLLNFYGKYLKDKPDNIVVDIDYLDYDWNLNDVSAK